MNLLLLLSALLSALTGVVGSARAPQIAQAVAGAEQGAAVSNARVTLVPTRPVQDAPSVYAVASAVGETLPLLSAEPIWAGRRRE